jgi:hypothetical protein
MHALGLGKHKPVYVDVEPYDVNNRRCVGAVLDYVEAWTRAMHRHDYVAGIYAHANFGVEPIALHAQPLPDDVWWALFDGDPRASYPTLHGRWKHHRIHQYGTFTETHHKQSFEIDRDTVHADVVGARPAPVQHGPGFNYKASPPMDTSGLNERDTPRTDGPLTHVYTYGDPIVIACQRLGDSVFGDRVWDKLDNGNFVSDLYTTTPGGIGFTESIPRC